MKTIKEDLKEHTEEVKKKVKGLGPVAITVLVLLLAILVCSYVFYDFFFSEGSIFRQKYDTDFLTGLMHSVPKIISCLQIISFVYIITFFLTLVISHIFNKSKRSITVSRLVCNLIRWVAVIVVIIGVLAAWDVDTTALITGAGVLTLVVGLGMQSLIADIVAGLFIVFENEFNVGDIITVNDFRGEVIEMGIRTTKLKALGNIKIFNNSDIREILNQTVELSTAKSLIDIEYGENIPKVEEIIKAKLPELTIEGAVEPVSYDGVNALGASGVTLQFTTKCYEGDIYSVQRKLNAALKNMFDENGIGIPFNQIVVHTAKD
ncbi:MAG: mechanosensitive ion channel family protein [Clostridiales bacterium]|nr:mechanosensitive ion channel family protein [Clostridiales bacterium]